MCIARRKRQMNSSRQPAHRLEKVSSPMERNGSNTLFKREGGMRNDAPVVPKGLANLGNTCFYNSAAQCLLNTRHLMDYLECVGADFVLSIPECDVTIYEEEIHLEKDEVRVIPKNPMPFVDTFKEFLQTYYSHRDPNPRYVFSEVAKRAPRFRGWNQQDSHELLRYLIDGLRQEELDMIGHAINEHLRSKGLKSDDPRFQSTKRAYMSFAKPVLDRVFAGSLIQIICCSECGHESVCFEPFLDLSLSIPKVVSGGFQQKDKNMSKNQAKKMRKKQKKKGKGRDKRPQRKNFENKVKNEEEQLNIVAESQAAFTDEEIDVTTGSIPAGETETNKKFTEMKIEHGKTTPDTNIEVVDANTSCNGTEVPGLNESEDENDVKDDENSENTPEEESSRGTELTDSISTLELAHPLRAVQIEEEKSIEYAFRRFTDPEDLRGSNAYECENCCVPENKKEGKRHRIVNAKKKYMLYTLPPVLTLHLKRFEKTQQHGRVYTTKVSDRVRFPLILDVAPYCSKFTEQIGKDQTEVLYSLYGIVSHSGSLSGGHYIAYVKSRETVAHIEKFLKEASFFDASSVGNFVRYQEIKSNAAAKSNPHEILGEKEARAARESRATWYFCSDSCVRSVSQETALSAEAYLLFYERFY